MNLHTSKIGKLLRSDLSHKQQMSKRPHLVQAACKIGRKSL